MCYIYASSNFVRVLLNYHQYGLFIKHQILLPEHNLCQTEFFNIMSFLLRSDGKPLQYKEDNVNKAFEVYLSNDKVPESGRWRFLMNRLALYCVDNKMRTIYGKPLETFTTFENCLNSVLSNTKVNQQLQYVLFGSHIEEANEDDEKEVKMKLMTPAEEFLRVNSLLTFIDVLDKLMVYTERGSIINIAKPSDAAKQFFLTNAASCQGWLARITVLIQKIGIKAGRYAQVVRFGNAYCVNVQQRSSKLKPGNFFKLEDNALMILGYLTYALVELNSSAAISGIRTFVKNIFNVDLEFTWPAEHIAEGKLELALDQINKLLSTQGFSAFVQELLHNFVSFNLQKFLLNIILFLENFDYQKT